MLEGVNNIDWEAFRYAEMPKLLHQLASLSSEARKAAYSALYAYGISELPIAAPHIIPFFIELLRVDKVEDKWALLYLLMEMATAAISEVEHRTKVDAYVITALQEISQGSDVYLQFARKPETAENAITLLSYLPSQFGELVPILETVMEANISSEMTTTAIKALNRFIASRKTFSIEEQHKYQTLLTSNLLAPDVTTRVETAIALIRLRKGDTPSKIEQALIDMVMKPNSEVRVYLNSLASVLIQLGAERTISAILYLMPRIEDMRTFFSFIQILLDLAFNNGIVNEYAITCTYHWVRTYQLLDIQFHSTQPNSQAIKAAHDLTETQRQVLNWLLGVSTIWKIRTNLWGHYGLPASVEEMRQLVASK